MNAGRPDPDRQAADSDPESEEAAGFVGLDDDEREEGPDVTSGGRDPSS